MIKQPSICFPSDVSKTYRFFSAGNLEQAINHVRLILTIIEDKQIESMILAAEVSLTQKQESLTCLHLLLARAAVVTPSSHLRFTEDAPNKTTRNASRSSDLEERVTKGDVEALELAILELKSAIKALNQSVFDTFEQSLALPLQVQYWTVVKE